MNKFSLNYLSYLEAESIHIFREIAACFANPVLLYSVGKDSSVLLHLAKKAFYPGKIPMKLLHVDTGFKFPEMYEFRENTVRLMNLNLLIFRNEKAIKNKTNPFDQGTRSCCGLLKTTALLDAIKEYKIDAAIGGARREEERSRAKERIFSFRNEEGQWDPKTQRPEIWNIYNTHIKKGQSLRVFPLSNWTELDIWNYIHRENINVVSMYFSKIRKVIDRDKFLIPIENSDPRKNEKIIEVKSRFRTLGCFPCTGAIRSNAESVPEIIEELKKIQISERSTRIIDHDSDGSMEMKKREGYF